MDTKKTLITTHTGEPSQPARIYYQVFKPKTVLRVFEKLRCVYFEPALQRWRWLYDNEAKKLRFKTSYSKIPKEAHIIALGEFFWRGETELLLEVRSLDRVVKAIEFFEKRINPRAAIATKIRVVNRLFAAQEPNVAELLDPPYDRFFDGDEVYIPQLSQQLEEVLESSLEADLEAIQAKFKEKRPEIEEIPLDSYREKSQNWGRLQFALTLRGIEAQQHFLGRDDFSQYDIMEKLAKSILEMMPEELKSDFQD